MRLGNGELNASNVVRITLVTIGISVVVDLISNALGWRIPWYAVTSVLTLFQYASESDLNYQDRVAFEKWKNEINTHLQSPKNDH